MPITVPINFDKALVRAWVAELLDQALAARRSLRFALGVALAENVADIVTTKLALDRGAVEANPVAAFLLDWHLLWPSKVAVMLLLALVLFAREMPRPTQVYRAWFVAGVYCCVVAVNLLVLWRLR